MAAFLAGNDVLLMPENVEMTIKNMVEAYKNGIITEKRLSESVKKVLMAKYQAGLWDYKPVEEENLYQDLNSPENDRVYEDAISNAITLYKNQFTILPLKKLQNKKIAYVNLGDDDYQPFLSHLQRYTKVTHVKAATIAEYKQNLRAYNMIIVGIHKNNDSPWKNHQLNDKERLWLQEIVGLRSSNSIVVSFTNPYALHGISDFSKVDVGLLAYQNSKLAQQKAAEIIFGAIGAKGKLPVSIWNDFPEQTGIQTKPMQRLGFTAPERVGFNTELLAQVDTLVQHGLDSLMFPGAQVLIAKKGKVVYHKSFGKPTFESKESITENHIYDLASLTKILGTLPMLMKLEEEGVLGLNDTFQELLPELKTSALKDVTVLKSLSHFGRLPAWIAFYLNTLNKEGKPSNEFYRKRPEQGYSIKVTDNLYLTDVYQDSIYNRIARQDLKSNRYRYSDVGYYVFKKYIENYYGKRLDSLVHLFFIATIRSKPYGLQSVK